MAVKDLLRNEAKFARQIQEHDREEEWSSIISRESGIEKRPLDSLGYDDIKQLLAENPAGKKIRLGPEENSPQVMDSDYPWDHWTDNQTTLDGLIREEGELTLFTKAYGPGVLDSETQTFLRGLENPLVPAVGVTLEEVPQEEATGAIGELLDMDSAQTYESALLPFNYWDESVPEKFRETFGAYEKGAGQDFVAPAIKLSSLNALRDELEEQGAEYSETHYVQTLKSGDYREPGRFPGDIIEG